jgi:hypothetical protein
MPTLVLRDSAEKDVGFLLAAGDEPFSAGGIARDIILMGLPLPSSSSLAEFIGNHKHVEYSARISKAGAGCALSFEISPGLLFQAQIEASGVGRWSVGSVGGGQCQLLAK